LACALGGGAFPFLVHVALAPGDDRNSRPEHFHGGQGGKRGYGPKKTLRSAFIILIIIAIMFALTEVAEYYLEIVRQN
jgi:hypothetical protein